VDTVIQFLPSIWGIIIALLLLFYGIVAACVPFFIYAIREDLRRTNKVLSALLGKNPPTPEEIKSMAHDMSVMKRIMTGETTSEADHHRIKQREDIRAQAQEFGTSVWKTE